MLTMFFNFSIWMILVGKFLALGLTDEFFGAIVAGFLTVVLHLFDHIRREDRIRKLKRGFRE